MGAGILAVSSARSVRTNAREEGGLPPAVRSLEVGYPSLHVGQTVVFILTQAPLAWQLGRPQFPSHLLRTPTPPLPPRTLRCCRLSKAQTAPDGLPDSLVLAAINAGHGSSRSPLSGSRVGAGQAAGAVPAQQHAAGEAAAAAPALGAARSGSNDSNTQSCATTNSNGRPPMPVTPAFMPARSGSGSAAMQQRGAGGPQRQGSSYRELFDAQVRALLCVGGVGVVKVSQAA